MGDIDTSLTIIIKLLNLSIWEDGFLIHYSVPVPSNLLVDHSSHGKSTQSKRQLLEIGAR